MSASSRSRSDARPRAAIGSRAARLGPGPAGRGQRRPRPQVDVPAAGSAPSVVSAASPDTEPALCFPCRRRRLTCLSAVWSKNQRAAEQGCAVLWPTMPGSTPPRYREYRWDSGPFGARNPSEGHVTRLDRRHDPGDAPVPSYVRRAPVGENHSRTTVTALVSV